MQVLSLGKWSELKFGSLKQVEHLTWEFMESFNQDFIFVLLFEVNTSSYFESIIEPSGEIRTCPNLDPSTLFKLFT